MNERSGEPQAATAKSDPESLVLRGSPARVVRFRRGAIVAIAALSSAAVMAVAWVGLSPPTFRTVSGADDNLETASPPEALAGAPNGYGDVPKLGPPLPGDLGRPILAHQRAVMATEGGTDSADQAAEAERQRAAADLKAARESGVLMQVAGASSARAAPERAQGGTGVPVGEAAGGAAPSEQAATATGPDSSARQRVVFASDQGAISPDVSPHRLAPPPSPYALTAGTILSASLITGLNSDIPGLVTAQITENAYDTVTGRILLVPQGSRLIGRYDSVVAFGQSRALVVWERILLPDGSSIRIDNLPASDTSGYAGLSDKIDRHTWQILKGVALSTLMGLGTELSFGDSESDLVAALRRAAQQSGARAGDQLVGKSLNIQPTIRVRPGWPLRIVVHKDIVLRPWDAGGA